MSDKSQILDRIRKVKKLAEQGIGGEKDTAQETLDMLMKKYNITDEELSDEEVKTREFWYHNEQEKKILLQLIYSRIADPRIYTYHRYGRKLRNRIGLDCTNSMFIELQFLYDFYVQLWYSEMNLLLKAYINKHHLYPLDPTGCNDAPELSFDEQMRLHNMERGLSDQSPIRRIENT